MKQNRNKTQTFAQLVKELVKEEIAHRTIRMELAPNDPTKKAQMQPSTGHTGSSATSQPKATSGTIGTNVPQGGNTPPGALNSTDTDLGNLDNANKLAPDPQDPTNQDPANLGPDGKPAPKNLDPIEDIKNTAIELTKTTRDSSTILKAIKSKLQNDYKNPEDAKNLVQALKDTKDSTLQVVATRLTQYLSGNGKEI